MGLINRKENEPQRLSEQRITLKNKLARLLWNVVWLILYRPSPIALHAWRCFLLRRFGAKIAKGALPYPSSRVWAPWNLTMGEGSCLSHRVDCYSVDEIILGRRVTVSQYAFLCTATHDYSKRSMPLLTGAIRLEDDVWVTSDVFVGPGVIVGEGAVIGARSTVLRNVPAWIVVAGNPLKYVGPRKFVDSK